MKIHIIEYILKVWNSIKTNKRFHTISLVFVLGALFTGLGLYGLDKYTDALIEKIHTMNEQHIRKAYTDGYNSCKADMALYIDRIVAEFRNDCELERTIITEKRIRAIIKKSNPELPEATQREYITYITKYSKEYGISPILVASVIHRESNYRTKLRSSVGAAGAMQVWAKWHKEKLKKNGIKPKDLYTIKYGVKIGCEVLSEYLGWEKGNFRSALYRYVGGQHHGYVRDIFRMCEFAFTIK